MTTSTKYTIKNKKGEILMVLNLYYLPGDMVEKILHSVIIGEKHVEIISERFTWDEPSMVRRDTGDK